MKRSRQTRTELLVGICALAFGIAVSMVKGNNAGIRDAIGNVSAPWLLIGFLGGAIAGRRRVIVGALTGTVATLIALLGFYVTNSFVLDLGPHPWLTDLNLAVVGGKGYFIFSLVSGPIFGTLGVWWVRTRSVIPVLIVGLFFVLEPGIQLARSGGDNMGNQLLIGLVEMALGVSWAIVTIRRTKLARRNLAGCDRGE
jgi:hypothetical protein